MTRRIWRLVSSLYLIQFLSRLAALLVPLVAERSLHFYCSHYVARITLRVARYRSFSDHSATLTAQSYSRNVRVAPSLLPLLSFHLFNDFITM
jgi:hypothetical protein